MHCSQNMRTWDIFPKLKKLMSVNLQKMRFLNPKNMSPLTFRSADYFFIEKIVFLQQEQREDTEGNLEAEENLISLLKLQLEEVRNMIK